MRDERTQAAIKATAQFIAEDDARAVAAGCFSIPADEVIVEPNPAAYIAPNYLKKTAPQLAPEFGRLLAMLRDLNAQFVGERTFEVQATLSLTGEHESLEEEFLDWCQTYFKIRGSLDRLNPLNDNDPWRLYQDCFDEFTQLVEKRIVQPGTINSSVLNMSQQFMVSSFAAQVLGPELESFVATGRSRYGSAANWHNSIRLVSAYNHQAAAFAAFLDGLAKLLPAEYAVNDNADWFSGIQSKVAQRAEDLNFLRYVLYSPSLDGIEKRQLTHGLWARFVWGVYHGSVATVLTSSSPEPSVECTSMHPLAFRRDGWLCHRQYPWLRVWPDDLPDGRRTHLAVSWYILDTLTSPLYEAWDRLDLDSVVSRGMEADATDEEQYAALAVAFVGSDTAEPEVAESDTPLPETVESEMPVAKRPRLPLLRLTRIQGILTKFFGCEWSMAKGSEQKVFVPGGKHFTFGCHGSDRTVQPVQLRNCLKKLGIPLTDFVTACQ